MWLLSLPFVASVALSAAVNSAGLGVLAVRGYRAHLARVEFRPWWVSGAMLGASVVGNCLAPPSLLQVLFSAVSAATLLASLSGTAIRTPYHLAIASATFGIGSAVAAIFVLRFR